MQENTADYSSHAQTPWEYCSMCSQGSGIFNILTHSTVAVAFMTTSVVTSPFYDLIFSHLFCEQTMQ